MNKYLVMLYHRDPYGIYRQEWVNRCINSIYSQTRRDFDVVEVDYSGFGIRLMPESTEYISQLSPVTETFVHTANWILDYARNQGYEGAFNVHLDDFYDHSRFHHQAEAIENGWD